MGLDKIRQHFVKALIYSLLVEDILHQPITMSSIVTSQKCRIE